MNAGGILIPAILQRLYCFGKEKGSVFWRGQNPSSFLFGIPATSAPNFTNQASTRETIPRASERLAALLSRMIPNLRRAPYGFTRSRLACRACPTLRVLALSTQRMPRSSCAHPQLAMHASPFMHACSTYSGRLASRARPRVTSSANSKSPPTGKPLAGRVTRTPSGLMSRAR